MRAFRDEFITASERLAVPSQTAHVLTLMFDLLDEAYRKSLVRDLA